MMNYEVHTVTEILEVRASDPEHAQRIYDAYWNDEECPTHNDEFWECGCATREQDNVYSFIEKGMN